MGVNWLLARKRNNLQARARIIQLIRQFFIDGGYLEVDTPLRIPAPAPEGHIDAIPADGWFLQTSPEICMKRLLAAGYDRLFQISHCWRQGERGSRHMPEFCMLEWYRSGCNYQGLMNDCEKLLMETAHGLGAGSSFSYGEDTVSLSAPWERLTVKEAFSRYGETTMGKALADDVFDEVMSLKIEPQLGRKQPTFLYDYPAERGALARLKPGDSTVAERFELYVAGMELANAFSELTDPVEQRNRFVQESVFRYSSGKVPYPLPEKFLSELENLPPSAGIALGVDRLVMLLLNVDSMDLVVPFTPEEL